MSIVESRERGDTGVCKESAEEGLYKAIEVITNITGVLCTEERWEKEDGIGLSISKQLDNQEQLYIATGFGFDR